MKRLVVMLGCLCAWTAPCAAAATRLDQTLQPVTIKHLTPGARVSAMASDRRGFLWFGTEEGVVRYDGFALEPLRGTNIPASPISALYAAEDGSLWIGTRGSNPLRRVREGALAADTISFPHGVTNVFDIVARGEDIFVGTNAGLFQVGRQLGAVPVSSASLPSGEVKALLVARDRSLWVAHHKGLMRMAPDGLKVVHDMPLPSALAQDPQGRIWVGHEQRPETLVYDESGKEIARFKSSSAVAMHADKDGTVWVATEDGLKRTTGLHSPVSVEFELSFDKRVEALTRDADGRLWLGTASHGAIQVDTNPAVRLLPASAPAFSFSVAEDANKAIWLSTTSSLLRIQDAQVDVLPYGEGTGLAFDIRALSPAAHGGIWAASARDGALHVQGAAGKPVVVRQFDARAVRTIFDDQKGTVWFGWEAGGLSRSNNTEAPSPVKLNVDATIITIAAAKAGGLWLGTLNHGLMRLFEDGRTRIFDTSAGLSSNRVFSVAEMPNGVVCLGTGQGGLDCMQDEHVWHYGGEEGVTDETVGSIVVDRTAKVWLGTTNGILRLDGIPAATQKSMAARRVGLSSGLRSVECAHSWANAALVLSDGLLIFATTHAAALVDPQRFAAQPPPRVIIDQVLLNGETKRMGAGQMNFPVGAGNLEIRYAAPRFNGSDALSFYYRLEGQDRDWVKAGSRRVAIYTNLAAGTYRFLVKAEEANAHTPATVTFRLLPPFHKTATFALLVFCLALGSLLLVLRFLNRQRRIRRSDILDERRRLARDLHDTVEQRVFAVRLQLDNAIQELTARTPSPSTASALVERAVDILGEASVEMRSAIHALRAPDMRARDLSLEISKAAAGLLRGSEVKFHLSSSQSLPHLPMDQHQQILRMVIEALTNSVKHGGANNVTVKLAPFGGGLEIKIQDDGAGFDTSAPPPVAHYGLMGMQERAQNIGATLIINGAPGAGTEVTVQLPQPERKPRAK